VPVISLLALGYPDGFDRLPERRPEAEVVAWERWEGRGA
jgi:nitroreductase